MTTNPHASKSPTRGIHATLVALGAVLAFAVVAALPGRAFARAIGPSEWPSPELTAEFTDLDQNAWYMQRVAGKGAFRDDRRTYLEYVIYFGLMSGYSGTTEFGPDDTLTRAMAATIIWRHATGADASAPREANASGLSDVEDNAWYTAAVNWAVESGVVTGYKNAAGIPYAFGPDDPVTREQLAAMIVRYVSQGAGWDEEELRYVPSWDESDFHYIPSQDDYIDWPGYSAAWEAENADALLASFEDAADVSSWARGPMAWCVYSGVMSGSGGRLMPGDYATRAQAAKMFAVMASFYFA